MLKAHSATKEPTSIRKSKTKLRSVRQCKNYLTRKQRSAKRPKDLLLKLENDKKNKRDRLKRNRD